MRKTYLFWLLALLMSYSTSYSQAFKSNNGNLKENGSLKKHQNLEKKRKELSQKTKVSDSKHWYSTNRGKTALDCPDESIYSNPLIGYTNASTSESVSGYSVATSFNFDGSIETVTFWSVNAFNDGSAWSACSNEDPMLFDVVFYEMGENGLGAVHSSYTDIASVSVATGEIFGELVEIYQHTIVLSTPCNLLNGFVSITGKSDNSCWFMWIDSPEGSGTAYQYDASLGTWDIQEFPYSLCLGGKPNTCLAPVDLTASNISVSTADLGWTELNTAAKWQVDFSYLEGTQVSSTIIDTDANPLTVEALNAQSFYEFSARAVCAEGDTSQWSMPLKFKTSCTEVANFPLTENFDGDWATWCWNVIDADADGITWNQDSIYITPVLSGKYAAHGMGNLDDYLISPQLVLDAVYQFTWLDKVESSSKNNTYEILVSTTGSSPADFTTNLGTFDCTNTNWKKHAVYLDQFSGQTIYVAIHQIYSASSWYGFGIEDVTIDLKPDCIPVVDLSVSNITLTTADLSWVETGDAAAWNIEYGIEGFVLGEGTSVKVTENPYTLTGLLAGMFYDFYVQADCGDGTAEWTGPVSFATLCETGTTIAESFEDKVPPTCWHTFANGAGTGVWVQDPYMASQGSYSALAPYENSGGDNEKWLVTGKTTIPEGKTLSFYTTDYFESDYGSTLSVKISTGSSYDIVADYVDLLTLNEADVTAGVFAPFNVDLSAYEGQDAYLAFVMVDNNGDTWNLDDVAFISCPAPSNITVSNITTSSVDISWTSNAASFTVEYGDAGFTLGEGINDKTTATNYSITGLTPSTTYDFYVKASCSDTDESTWVGPFTFGTSSLPCEDITVFPYFEGFEGQVEFDCWTAMYNTASDGGLDGTNLVTPPTTNSWFVITPESFDGNGVYYIFEGTRAAGLGYTAPDFNWLVSPNIVLPSKGGNLTFMLWLKDSVEVAWITKFYVNIYDGATWTTALSYGDGTPDNEFEQLVEVDLTVYASKTIKVAFVFEFNDGYELAIDNITINSNGTVNDQTDVLTYSIAGEIEASTINTTNHTIDAKVVSGTDVTALVATYTLSDGAAAKVGNAAQVSAQTPNNFTNPVVYKVTAEDGVSTQDWTVTVTPVVGVRDGLANRVNIYPNPSNGNFIVEGAFGEKAMAKILDVTGKTVTTVEINSNKQNIDLSAFGNGVYFVEIANGNQKAMFKVFKQ